MYTALLEWVGRGHPRHRGSVAIQACLAGAVVALLTGAPVVLAQEAAPPLIEAPAPLPPVSAPEAVASPPEAALPMTPAENTLQVPGPVPEAAATEQGAAAQPAPVPSAVAPAPLTTPPVVAPSHGLSPWEMFLAADMVVKGVMIGLAFASIVTWTVWLAKSLEIFAAKAKLRRGLRRVLTAQRLDQLERDFGEERGPTALMVHAAAREVAASAVSINGANAEGLLDRVASHLSRIEAQASRRMNAGTGVLATIGSTAPFVGLFGTVWGIMNSFIGIAETKTTNLAVVAPGIAEALLATAMGLVAAIPAVVIYNQFARGLIGYRALLTDTSAAVERLVSRDLDHHRLTEPALRRAAE